ncbi:MAG: hypothetical protein RMJ14_00010 [Nitrososphaerota archaeon]|nr:hypothetical protein [Nitrososphaerota archaeon]
MRWKKQNKVIAFRINSSTYKKLKKLAKGKGNFTVSEYLRGLIEEVTQHPAHGSRRSSKMIDAW